MSAASSNVLTRGYFPYRDHGMSRTVEGRASRSSSSAGPGGNARLSTHTVYLAPAAARARSVASSKASGPTGQAGGVLHPQIGSHPAQLRHALKLRANGARFFHLLFNLKRDHVADRIVGQVQERVNHVRIDSQQHYIVLVEDGSVIAVPDVFRNLHGGLIELVRRGFGWSYIQCHTAVSTSATPAIS